MMFVTLKEIVSGYISNYALLRELSTFSLHFLLFRIPLSRVFNIIY